MRLSTPTRERLPDLICPSRGGDLQKSDQVIPGVTLVRCAMCYMLGIRGDTEFYRDDAVRLDDLQKRADELAERGESED